MGTKDVQQQQTLDYFRRSAGEWRQKAEGSLPKRVNVIQQRNQYVLDVASSRSQMERSLDVGCGTGELVCALAKTGVRAVGIDFAAEMVELCRQKAQANGIAGTEFVYSSIFDYRPVGAKFDLISANGFIEYVSEGQLLEFITLAKTLLVPGGSLVVGSRNRLFNAFSLNEYTRTEIDKGAFHKLIAEAMILSNVATTKQCIEELLRLDDPLPSINHHPRTGIDVATRHQYTPRQLIGMFNGAGFHTVGLVPIHYHGVVPRFAREHPEVHVAVADLIHGYASSCHYLIPFASSFMLQFDMG